MAVTFTRRELESSLLDELEAHRMVVVTGPRGAGKTTLLQGLRARWRGVAALVQMEPVACSPEVLRSAFAELAGEALGRVTSAMTLHEAVGKRARGSLLLLDDIAELRTLSYYPGVEKPLDGFLAAIASAKEATVVTSRFDFWMRRHFPELHYLSLPPLSVQELESAGVREPELVAAATGGLAVHARHLADGDVEETLSDELERGGRIDAECRATYAELLHRARGYGACKWVLRILADEEGLNLTEVARRMDRTPGSTRDYLLWLEEVDLLIARKKRYFYIDPILRLWMRVHGQGCLATQADIQREVRAHLESVEGEVTEDAFRLPSRPSENLVEFD